MKPKIIVYLPVIHKGYLQLFEKHKTADIFIANKSLIEFIDKEFDYLRKEIRSITPNQAEISLEALLPKRQISLIDTNDLMLLDNRDQEIILPKEDIFIWLAKNYLTKSKVKFDDTFLRWNRENSVKKNKITPTNEKLGKDSKSSLEIFNKLINKTNKDAKLSSDWWRQVGAIIFKESKQENKVDQPKIISIAHNQHLPSPYSPYINSDPRNSFHKGENIDLCTAIHAEAALIADAAKKGISLNGMSMYVTTFPCPPCAKQVAASGISKLYFKDGYSMLDGETILKNSNVKIIKI
jgi:dCMP deaminase